MRMILIAGLLMVALLGAVLTSVGAESPRWVSAPDEYNGPPEREISDRATPGSLTGTNRG
jgi:hypothetical protein